jgi:hypothetical protein
LTKRSAFCFVWQSEAADYLNTEARQKEKRNGLAHERQVFQADKKKSHFDFV